MTWTETANKLLEPVGVVGILGVVMLFFTTVGRKWMEEMLRQSKMRADAEQDRSNARFAHEQSREERMVASLELFADGLQGVKESTKAFAASAEKMHKIDEGVVGCLQESNRHSAAAVSAVEAAIAHLEDDHETTRSHLNRARDHLTRE